MREQQRHFARRETINIHTEMIEQFCVLSASVYCVSINIYIFLIKMDDSLSDDNQPLCAPKLTDCQRTLHNRQFRRISGSTVLGVNQENSPKNGVCSALTTSNSP